MLCEALVPNSPVVSKAPESHEVSKPYTDRGCQYTAGAYQAVLAARGIAASMSRAGDCYDNAMAKSFFGTLKAELVDTRPWSTGRAAQQAIFAWIEVWYNRRRFPLRPRLPESGG